MNTSKMILPAIMTVFLAGGTLIASNAMAAPHDDHGGKHEMQAHGGGMMGDCPMMSGGHGGKGHGKMQLTPEQRQKLQAIMQETNGKLNPLRDQLFIKRQELKALQSAANPDVKAVGEKAKEITELRAQLRKERVALGERIDKELGLEPGTHDFSNHGPKGGHGK